MKHILFFLPTAVLLAACTQDELTDNGQGTPLPEPIPLELTAAIGEAVAAPAKTATRATTVDGQWPAEDATVYVQISETEAGFDDDNVLNYSVDANGNLKPQESKDIYYWTKNGQTIYVRAWYPGGKTDWNGIPKEGGKTWTAEIDQSTETNLAKGDFLYAYQQLTYGSQSYTLDFKHLMSKITINLESSAYLQQYDPADVSVSLTGNGNVWQYQGDFENSGKNLELSEATGGDTGNSMIPYKFSSANGDYFVSFEAIVIPQGVLSRGQVIEVKVGNAAAYRWDIQLPSSQYQMTSGVEYTFNITVDAKGLTVVVGQNIGWDTDGASGEGSVTLR